MSKKLLVVVDMQVDFITGALGTKEAAAIVPAVVERIKKAQALGEDIIFTMDTHGEDYLATQEGAKLPVEHCIKATDGWRLHPEIEPLSKGHTVIEKPGFGSTTLGELGRNYDRATVIGLCTDICVISNAFVLKAFNPELFVNVDPRLCAGVTPESHQRALDTMAMAQVGIIEEA